MTSCEESQQNDKDYQGDRWDDGHAKSLSRDLLSLSGVQLMLKTVLLYSLLRRLAAA
jgi:hypothetical protein